jgi:peptide/nickel transport system ATP-binding protein/oligopeptide transport system ATP-binding protein
MNEILRASDVEIEFQTRLRLVQAVRGVSFAVGMGDAVAIVGASGSGKTVLSRSLLGLVAEPGVVRGKITFDGIDIVGSSESELRKVRGLGIAMVFQDSLDGLNPVFSIGAQLTEMLTVRLGMSRRDAKAEAIRLMQQVGIPKPEERFYSYPHQFSGGMRQRICIAMAIGLKPKILIADEPTTALDVTVQAGILRLIRSLQKETGMGLIFVTHDLAVARLISRRVIVMLAGKIVEQGATDEVFERPQHPYTRALLAAHPGRARSWRDLEPIPDDFVTDSTKPDVPEPAVHAPVVST